MWNMILRFITIALIAIGAVWLVDHPGTLTIDWMGQTIEVSIIVALILLIVFVLAVILSWGAVRRTFHIPAALADFLRHRKRKNLSEALTKGIIAVGAGDAAEAARYARKASNIAANDPLAQILRAQAAQLRGDRGTVSRIFAAMVQVRDTEVLGIRGLFNQARQDGDTAKARALAQRALELSPGLAWASKAVLAFQSTNKEWAAVGRTLDSQRSNGLLSKAREKRLQAVVLTARALELEEEQPREALSLAERALKSVPDLVPAAVVAGRLLSGEQNINKGARLLEKAWKLNPHPDIAESYAYLRSGDSPQDRRQRIEALVAKHEGGVEGDIALTISCIDTQDWKQARKALKPHVDNAAQRPSVRICELMAEIEQGEFGDKGRSREWLSRAVRAPRDPVWIADGMISSIWLPVSPVTGELDAFEWTVPQSAIAVGAFRDPALPLPAEGEEEEEDVGDVVICEPEAIDEVAVSVSEPEAADEIVLEPVTGNGGSESKGAVGVPSESEDPLDMRRPDDPGPRAPEKAKKPTEKSAWYKDMFCL